jgi:hypothetical protein
VGRTTVASLLDTAGYRRVTNRKTFQGGDQIDRDAQFEHIDSEAAQFSVNRIRAWRQCMGQDRALLFLPYYTKLD